MPPGGSTEADLEVWNGRREWEGRWLKMLRGLTLTPKLSDLPFQFVLFNEILSFCRYLNCSSAKAKRAANA